MKQECETAILDYAPLIRQTNAYLFDEHRDYVVAVITIFRNHYHELVESGATEWSDPDATVIQWLNENKPY
jgi:hypothetical protein